jgi:YihY family inner membrane protein
MDSDSILSATATAPALVQEPVAQAAAQPWNVTGTHPWKQMFLQRGLPTLRYLAKTESHTFAFSVAANVILSFFPFIFLLMWLVRNVFHSEAMLQVVDQLVRDHLPVAQGFVIRNLGAILDRAGHKIQIASIIMLLISSSGVFLPLEVAFNRIWGFPKNRSYLGNQLVSLLLAFACGTLALFSVALAVGNESALSFILQGHADFIVKVIAFVALKAFAITASIAIFFLIYWILPNGKVAARSVLPAAVAMGLLWELAKYVYMVVLPWLNFRDVYGPFYISVTLMFWAFISGLMVLAGAHLVAGPGLGTAKVQAATGIGPT